MLSERPMSSFELCETLRQKHDVDKRTTSKRLERLYKRGKIGRFLRIERGAYVYYVPGFHSMQSLQETTRDIVSKRGGTLGRLLKISQTGRIVSVFEIGRIANTKFFPERGQTASRINDLTTKLEKLGFRLLGHFFLSPSVTRSEANGLITQYENAIDEEASLLAYARRLFISKRRAEEMTLYRQPSDRSLAEHKFDLFGHGGRINQIRIVAECNLRREITLSDLESYSQRIGGTAKRSQLRIKKADRSPIARYYIARSFSEKAIAFASRGEQRIRLLDAGAILNGSIEEINPRTFVRRQKPHYYGRFKEAKGIAFEAEIEQAYMHFGFKTKRRKTFYLLGGQITEKDTGKPLTDVDLFAERKNGPRDVLLIECKSSAENLAHRKLFEKTKAYWHIADYLHQSDPACKIRIDVIANVDEFDKKELVAKSRFRMSFLTPAQFYNQYPKALKGAPKWMFGL